MKATDLMIGDWVQNPLGWKAQVQFIRYVNTIKDEWEWLVKIGINNETFQSNLSLNEIGAIPLTPEILEKNGWYIPEDGLWYRHDVIGFLIALRTSGAYLYADEEHDRREFFCSIHFVHELQHALRLCGIEKEIEL